MNETLPTSESAEPAVALPECDHRHPTDEDDLFFCSHARVRVPGGVVTPTICQLCTMREVESFEPRDVSTMSLPAHRPPGLLRQGWNLAQSVAAFVADGCRTLSEADYQARLEICDACDRRRGNRCLECGCRLSTKARGRAFQCPLGKWPQVDRQTNDQPSSKKPSTSAAP